MNIESLLNAWPLMLTALLLGIGLVVGLVVALDAGTRFKLEWMGLFFLAVPLAMVVGVVIQQRTLGVELGGWRPDLEDFATSNWASRVLTLLCVGLAAERLVRFVLRREYRGAEGGGLLIAMLFYILSVNVVSAFLGTKPTFSHQMLYAPLFALGMFAYGQHNAWRMVLLVRAALLAFLVVSLLCLPVRPAMVAETNYGFGLVAGFALRFYGFATHPNTLAPLCFVLMCCLLLRPFSSKLLQRLAWGVAWICLLLTQSKTSVGLTGLLIALLWGREQVVAARQSGGIVALRARVMTLVTTAVVVVALVAVAALLLTLFSGAAATKIGRVFENMQVTSLTGRTTIWAQTLKAVGENPLFGYGPGLWGIEYRMKTGLFFTHAHNQYLQTFGAGGLLGLSALAVYLVVLMRAAWKTRKATHGVSVALAAYLILRGLTEVPLSVSAAMQAEFLVQMFLFVLCVGALRGEVLPAAVAAAGAVGPSRVRPPAFRPAPVAR